MHCLACRAPSSVARIRSVCGLALCDGCSADVRGNIEVKVRALATEMAHRIAAKRFREHVADDERDPIERVLAGAWLAIGPAGVLAVIRALFAPHVPSELAAAVEAQAEAYGESEARGVDEERALYALGLAILRRRAAEALSRALDRLSAPACDLRGVLSELREAVELIRRAQAVEGADAAAERGEVARRPPPRRRDVPLPSQRREQGRAA
jgi:hypothetical protein